MKRFEPKYQTLIPASDAYVLSAYQKNIIDIKEKIKNLEKELESYTSDSLNIIKNLNEPLYQIWYYTDSDIHNNGGVKTVLEEKDLINLFKFYENNEETSLYILNLIDLRANVMGYTPKFPECVNDKYKNMILNAEFNNWHKTLLS